MDSQKKAAYFKNSPPIGLLITRVAAKYEEEFIERINEDSTFSDVTVSDHRVLRHITLSDSNSVDIAGNLGISKQALSKSISSLEKRGYVTRAQGLDDKRTQTLSLTKKGEKLISKAIKVATELERKTSEILGTEKFQLFQISLKSLLSKNLAVKKRTN